MGRTIVGRNPDGSYRYASSSDVNRAFDELAQAVESGVEKQNLSKLVEDARQEYRLRREVFVRFAPAPTVMERAAVSLMNSSGQLRYRPTPLGCALVLAVIGIGASLGPWGFFATVFFIIFAGLTMESRRNARMRHANQTLEPTECRKCGYLLAGLQPILPESEVGFDLGPRACPECGEPWPKVPPIFGP